MAQPSLIIFDCDGVLVDSEVLCCRCMVAVLARYGVETSLEEVMRHFLGRGINAVFEHYASKKPPLPPEFASELRQAEKEVLVSALRPMEGVTDVLEKLEIPSCVASASDPERVSLCLASTGLDKYFPGRVFTSNAVRKNKPAPDLFLHVAAAMNALPRETLVIEDSVNGVLAGRAAQMTVWGFVGGSHFASGIKSSQLHEAGAHRLFSSMDELLGLN